MGKTITLEEVLAYPGQLGIEPMGIGFEMIFFSVVFIVGVLMATQAPNSDFVGMISVIFFLFGLTGVLYSIAYIHMASDEVIVDYETGYKEWKAEYVEPYINSLPTKQVNHLAEVEYDYRLEAEAENTYTGVPKGLIPLKITEKNGETYSVWGKVEYNEKVEFQFYLYRELTQTLDFEAARNASNLDWYPPVEAGKQEIILYTNNRDLQKYDISDQ